MSHQISTDTPYVYIFVRKDLPPGQQIVQACHAVAECAHQYFKDVSEHPHFVILGVKDESALLKALKKIEDNEIHCAFFKEADLQDQFTALATEPVYGEKRRIFRSFQILKPQTNYLDEFYEPAEYGWTEEAYETRKLVREFCKENPQN